MDPAVTLQHASSLPVWVLYLVIIVPMYRLLRLTLDAWANEVRDVLWVRRNRWERSITAAVLMVLLACNRAAFAEHLRLVAVKEVPLLVRAHFGAVLEVDPNLPKRRLLVIGEVGDGKSTMVSALRDPAQAPLPETGKHPRGITKAITNYIGLPINGQRIELLDTPGIGDMDITPTKLISLLEERLGSHHQAHVDGVLVTSPVSDGRIKLGAQVVATIVDKGFLGGDKWSNIILVGTKSDRAEDDKERTFFREEIGREFFSRAPKQHGSVVLVSRDDYSELRNAIAQLPSLGIAYQAPDAETMAKALADRLGVQMKDFQQQLETAREEIRLEYREQLERQRKELTNK